MEDDFGSTFEHCQRSKTFCWQKELGCPTVVSGSIGHWFSQLDCLFFGVRETKQDLLLNNAFFGLFYSFTKFQ